jgi:phage terminase large subunit-like protein
MYRVAAVAGTNDGGNHSFRIADELHEWDGRKERVHSC